MDLFQVLLAVPLVTTMAYFVLSKDPSIRRRTLAASHGAILLMAVGYAFAASHWSTFGNSDAYSWPFFLLLLLFLAAVGYGFFAFKGTRIVHVLQLVQLPAAFWLAVIGGMTIAHDSF